MKNFVEYDIVAEQFGEETAMAVAAAIRTVALSIAGMVNAVAMELGPFHAVVARAIYGQCAHESDVLERAAELLNERYPTGANNVDPAVYKQCLEQAVADIRQRDAEEDFQEFLSSPRGLGVKLN